VHGGRSTYCLLRHLLLSRQLPISYPVLPLHIGLIWALWGLQTVDWVPGQPRRESAALQQALRLYPDFLAAARNGTALEAAHAEMQHLGLDTSWQPLNYHSAEAVHHVRCA